MKKFKLPAKVRIGLDIASSDDHLRRVFPFRRSWIALGVLIAIDIAVMVPAILTFQEAAKNWGSVTSLFELVTAIFLSAWVLGWSIAPLILTIVIILMLTGREVLTARPGMVRLGIGIPGLLAHMRFNPARIRNLRFTPAQKGTGTSWRGSHLSFDYLDTRIDFGSAMNETDLVLLSSQIQSATGIRLRHGDALPGETGALVTDSLAPEKESRGFKTQSVSTHDSVSPVSLGSVSTLTLIGANLVPFFGALYLGWNLADVMVLYWAESAVVGFYNVIRIVVVEKWLALITGPFFIGHFGAFMAVHFLFLYMIFVKGPQATGGGDLHEVARLFIDLWPALAVLFLSHGISFVMNFLGRKEYRQYTTEQLMKGPYSRIVFMHLVLILGGGITLVLGDPVPVLVLVILLKIVFDVRGHLKQHDRLKGQAAS